MALLKAQKEKLHRSPLRKRNICWDNGKQDIHELEFSAQILLVFLFSVLWEREEKRNREAFLWQPMELKLISSYSSNQRMLVRASVLNCSACVFIGNKCLCFVWVKVKGSYSVGITSREYFETKDRRSNITGRMRSDQHLMLLLSSGPLNMSVCDCG